MLLQVAEIVKHACDILIMSQPEGWPHREKCLLVALKCIEAATADFCIGLPVQYLAVLSRQRDSEYPEVRALAQKMYAAQTADILAVLPHLGGAEAFQEYLRAQDRHATPEEIRDQVRELGIPDINDTEGI